jgi:uncharacterized membrane protein HdeD (DUF308 family)
MARQKKAQKKASAARRPRRRGTLAMGHRNMLMLFCGIALIVIGYLLLGRGSITAAPVLLVLGYCVVVPLSIILWVKRPDTGDQSEAGE